MIKITGYSSKLNNIILVVFFFMTNIVLSQSSIKVISPNGNEKLQIKTRQSIVWISENIERIDIFYSTDNGNIWNKITENISAELGVVGWKIPNLIGKNAILKIVSHSNNNVFDVSDNPFSFTENFSIKGSLNKNNKITSETVIMPLGNSITFDNRVDDNREIGNKVGYRKHLYELLTDAGVDFSFTGSEHSGGNFLPAGYDANAGFPGITDDQLLELLKTGRRVQPYHGIDEQITPGKYFDTYPADIVLLHIGTNGNDGSSGTSPDDIEGILDNIDSISTNTIVILARIIDREPNKSYVTQLNDNVETMALDRVNNSSNDAYPDEIIIVDMQRSANIDYTIDSLGTIGNGIKGDMNDKYHPNDKGYYKMAEVWFNALRTILVTSPVIINQPENFSTVVGKSAQFRISANGTDPFSFQWKRNGANIVGATDSVYQINSVTDADNNIRFSCSVSNSSGTAISNEAVLFVAGENKRVKNSLQILYSFEENDNKVIDLSGVSSSVDLTINNTTNTNRVSYGLEVTSSTIISASSSPTKIFNSCTTTNEISIEAWIKPQNITQNGPSRIITFSQDGSERNFTFGQIGNKYNIRLKTSTTDNNGEPSLSSSVGSLTTELTHIVYTRNSSGVAKIYINGSENSLSNVPGNFSTWNNTFLFGLANEFTTDRTWLGTYYLVAVYNRALSLDEVEHNYIVSFNGFPKLLFAPTELVGTVKNDSLVQLIWEDNSNEELGYIMERKANSIDSIFVILDTLSANTTSYTDHNTKHTTTYFYKVKAYNNKYISDYSNFVQVDDIVSSVANNFIANNFKLYQNYPNPFNPTTTITYSIPKTSKVSLIVYDALGQVVTRLLDNVQTEKGIYGIKFNASANRSLTSGVYYYRFLATPLDKSKPFIQTKKLLLLK